MAASAAGAYVPPLLALLVVYVPVQGVQLERRLDEESAGLEPGVHRPSVHPRTRCPGARRPGLKSSFLSSFRKIHFTKPQHTR